MKINPINPMVDYSKGPITLKARQRALICTRDDDKARSG